MKIQLINYTGSVVSLIKTIRCAKEIHPGATMSLHSAKKYVETLITEGHCELAYTFDQGLDDRQFVIDAALTDSNNLHHVALAI